LEADSSVFINKATLCSIQDVPASKEIAVVLHLYYTDLWQEIASYLTNIRQPFDLFISVPLNTSEKVIRDIIHCYPGAHILHTKNRGRDIAPFIELLGVISKRGYSYGLKIHTKRSPHREDGDIWRQAIFKRLIGDEESVNRIIFSLKHIKNIGVIAPSGHLVNLKNYIDNNAYHMENLGRQLGLNIDYKLSFCAGSMFWFKPQALSALLDLNLKYTDFEPEAGQIDGVLGHAIERFIGQVVAANHYNIITEQDVLCGRFQGGATIIDNSYKFGYRG
jgi:lipopolysaccharide biosynthesis protein